jgi:type II secretory pathway pseudopilin PulG
MRTRSSFTLIELIIVIIIIAILAYSLNFKFFNNSLQLASDSLINNIRFTQSLALKDDKYQPFPLHKCDGSIQGKIECNRTKYWFKQWWHLKITTAGGDIIYYIFSDQPKAYPTTNFDKKVVNSAQYTVELAKNPEGKYLIGASKDETGSNSYPPLDEIDTKLNLTKTYNIVQVEYNNQKVDRYHPLDLLFDNYGNVFQSEGIKGDKGDINPLYKREILTSILHIKLCNAIGADNKCLTDKKHCIQINITPTGFVYKSLCTS